MPLLFVLAWSWIGLSPIQVVIPCLCLLVMSQPRLFWNVECHRVLFWDHFYYAYPLRISICQSDLSYRYFADDSQLYKSSFPLDFPVIACCLKDCIEDIAEWMSGSKLKMNDGKTEFVAIDTRLNSKISHIIPELTPLSMSYYLVMTYLSLSLVKTLVSTRWKTFHTDAHINKKKACATFFFSQPCRFRKPLLPVH